MQGDGGGKHDSHGDGGGRTGRGDGMRRVTVDSDDEESHGGRGAGRACVRGIRWWMGTGTEIGKRG